MAEAKHVKIVSLSDHFDDWFRNWCQANKCAVTYRGAWTMNERPVDYLVLRAKLFLECRQFSKKFNYQDIDASLILMHSAVKEQYLDAFRAKMRRYQPNDTMEKFVRAITGGNNPKSIAVLRHFVWQVKRKALNMPVERHMMPVLSGKQDGGKSTAVTKLIEPLGDFTLPKTVESLTDERHWESFRDYFVIFLDEMAKATRSCIQTLKMVVTAKEINYKPLRTNNQIVFFNRSTFIGATNETLDMLIKDSTGSRRFYQIETLDNLDFNLINSLDYDAVWDSVSPNEECPITKVLPQIKEHQEETRFRSDVELFVEESELAPSETARTSTDQLYKSFVMWCENSGATAGRKSDFGKTLKSLGFVAVQYGGRSKRTRGFKCFAPEIPFEPVEIKKIGE